MSLPKINQGREGAEITSQGALEEWVKSKPAPKEDPVRPEKLLEALKEKHRDFQTLKEKGLLHANHLSVEAEMKKAISDLEEILAGMEEI